METKRDELLKLYELAINEHHHYGRTHQDRITYYSGLLSALVTATAIGLLQSSEWYHFAFLCVGPILIFAISTIAISATSRFYRRLLECITVRAKIEQNLGLTSTKPNGTDRSNAYWISEEIIPSRHLRDRKDYKSSADFIDERMTKGYQLWVERLFLLFQGVSVAMLIFLVSLAVLKAQGCL